jgi:DNA helicase-2/ATP-dependent DNA helicase PcrA
VVVLDEYQDTNPAQRILLTSVFSDGFPVIAVGDEDQTIYEWRGATPENFALFTTHFPGTEEAPALDLGLTANLRSAQQILDIANLIRARANRDAENLVAVDPSRHGETTVQWAQDSLAEADWIAEQFTRLHADGVHW